MRDKSKLMDLVHEIKGVEVELVQAYDRYHRAVMELEYRTADVVSNTPWKQHGITNQHGRDSFVVLHTMEEREEKIIATKDIYMLKAKRDALVRTFKVFNKCDDET